MAMLDHAAVGSGTTDAVPVISTRKAMHDSELFTTKSRVFRPETKPLLMVKGANPSMNCPVWVPGIPVSTPFSSDYSRDTAVDCHRSWSMVQG